MKFVFSFALLAGYSDDSDEVRPLRSRGTVFIVYHSFMPFLTSINQASFPFLSVQMHASCRFAAPKQNVGKL